MSMRREALLPILMLALPACASAQEASAVLPQLAGFANIFVGLMLVTAFLLFGGGFLQYITHLGLDERDEGLGYMKWGVSVAFTLAVLLGFAQFVQLHVTLVIFTLGALVVILIGWFILSEVLAPPEKKEEKK